MHLEAPLSMPHTGQILQSRDSGVEMKHFQYSQPSVSVVGRGVRQA
jgi:hypothetical protein